MDKHLHFAAIFIKTKAANGKNMTKTRILKHITNGIIRSNN